jgi:hypothetical protein
MSVTHPTASSVMTVGTFHSVGVVEPAEVAVAESDDLEHIAAAIYKHYAEHGRRPSVVTWRSPCP